MNTDMELASLDEVDSSVMDSDQLMVQNDLNSASESGIDEEEDSMNDYDTFYDSETGEKHSGRHVNKHRVLLDGNINHLDSDEEDHVRVAKGLNDDDKELVKTLFAKRQS
jgi:hypothetical protein